MPVVVRRNFSLGNVALVTRDDLKAAGEEALLIIRQRTHGGMDANGAPFTPYSEGYAKHKGAYVFSGLASSTKVDLTLTGEMLNNMQVVDVSETTSTVSLGWVR